MLISHYVRKAAELIQIDINRNSVNQLLPKRHIRHFNDPDYDRHHSLVLHSSRHLAGQVNVVASRAFTIMADRPSSAVRTEPHHRKRACGLEMHAGCSARQINLCENSDVHETVLMNRSRAVFSFAWLAT